MAYKPVAARKTRREETFEMGETRTIRQRNGVVSTVTTGFHGEGHERRPVYVFANGARSKLIAAHLAAGRISRLVGKWSQHNVFVALAPAQA